jgi:hypothetical protein
MNAESFRVGAALLLKTLYIRMLANSQSSSQLFTGSGFLQHNSSVSFKRF